VSGTYIHTYIQYLRIVERRILRNIFGPVQNEDGFWRIRMNYELRKTKEKMG
jgi:ribosomal protein S28E/S33